MPTEEIVVEWRENTARGLARGRVLRVLWEARELIAYFALRDVKLRYRQAIFGVVWVLFLPVSSVAVFTVVFHKLAGLSSEGAPYPLFALVGMVTWTYVASAVQAGSAALVVNASLVTKVYFPRIAAPASALLPPAIDLAVSLVLVAVAAAYYHVFSGIRLVGVALWLALMVVIALGLTLWLSALNVRYRDVKHAVGPFLQLWFFASPVAYPATLLHGWQEALYAVNPVVGAIGVGRWALLGTPWPGWEVAVSAGTALVVLAGGLAYFDRAQRSFADVI